MNVEGSERLRPVCRVSMLCDNTNIVCLGLWESFGTENLNIGIHPKVVFWCHMIDAMEVIAFSALLCNSVVYAQSFRLSKSISACSL